MIEKRTLYLQLYGLIDTLAYTYSGNKVTSIKDTGSAAYSSDFRYSNGTNNTYTYTYDASGRMTKDTSKGITSITWNVLGLPQTVTFSGGAVINYSYAADGTKLRESRTASGTTTTTDYTGNVVLEDGERTRLLFDGGYMSLSDNAYHYFLTDHLGSVRVVANGSGTAEEYDHYYPLGGPIAKYSSSTSIQPLKFQGKEWGSEKGLNLYDFGARRYDPATGRWLSQDPLAEKYYAHSPYLFCGANPMRYVDPTGTDWYKNDTAPETLYYWFSGDLERDGFTRIGGEGSVLGSFEGHINDIMSSLGLGSLYENGFSFRLADNSTSAFANETGPGLFREFVSNSGPEFTVFNDYHPYTRELKNLLEVKDLQKDILTGRDMEDSRHFRTERVDWGLLDIIPNIQSEAREFIGSFRYYGYMNSSLGIDNIIFDSKSRHSFFLHLLKNKSREDSSLFGNTYQFYIWKSSGR